MTQISEFGAIGNYEGGGVHNHETVAGFAAARRKADSNHRRRVQEAARLFADVYTGRLDPVFLREAMSPRTPVLVAHLAEKYPALYGQRPGYTSLQETMSFSDYQALYVDVLDRMYYGYYNAYPVVNMPLVKKHPLRDFRIVSRYLLDGMVTPFVSQDPAAPVPESALLGPAPQNGSTPSTAATSTAPLQYQPKLYAARAAVNWRAIVNDDLGIFSDIANRLAIAANRGISKFITQLYLQTSGPNTSLYAAGYRNLITTTYGASSNNPPLSIQGIQDAFKVLAGMLDSTGDPILMSGTPIIWYGPQYEATAKNLQNMLSSQVSVEGGTTNADGFPSQFVQVNNWAVSGAQWIMDPYVPIVASSAKGSWGITMAPGAQNRPAMEVGFLRGFETPQIFSKLPNTQRLGGGVDPMMGDFYSLDQELKILSVFGGCVIDGRSAVASNGSGS